MNCKFQMLILNLKEAKNNKSKARIKLIKATFKEYIFLLFIILFKVH